ncbi:transposable element Tc3 transposase [Trichonephila clavipes]|nr:transposable element Tc3 transposase [Trichonephila clavipes]
MDDNATCHRTLAVQDCLDSEGIQRLVWPARSPDLNPIENVWDAFGRQVAGRNYPPTNKNTLIRALTEEWDKLPQQLLDNVVQSHFLDKSKRFEQVPDMFQLKDEITLFHFVLKKVFFVSDEVSLIHLQGYAYSNLKASGLNSENHKKRARLLLSQEHVSRANQEWGRVLFTDESRFSTNSASPRVFIWIEPGTLYHPSNIRKSDRFGGCGILV